MYKKFFAFSEAMTVDDESLKPAYAFRRLFPYVTGQFLLQDSQGTRLARVKSNFTIFVPTFHVFMDDRPTAEIRRRMASWPAGNFEIEIPGTDYLMVEGDSEDTQYLFQRHGRLVGRALRDRVTLSGTYRIEVLNEADMILLLASMFVIARVCGGKDDSSD